MSLVLKWHNTSLKLRCLKKSGNHARFEHSNTGNTARFEVPSVLS
mgnify:CR=1 FL=1